MIKLAFFISEYWGSGGKGDKELPAELRRFASRRAFQSACYEKLGDGRSMDQFLRSVDGDIDGFRTWKAKNRPNHPHPDVLKPYLNLKRADRYQRLWNEVSGYFQSSPPSGVAHVDEKPPPSSCRVKGGDTDEGQVDDEDSNSATDDEAEFAVQNSRQEIEIRQKQSLFRRRVLHNYHGRCCLTGIAEPCLLVARHIIPWSKRVENRLDPRNGVLLSVLMDRLFDKGLITFDDNLRVIVVPWLAECSGPLQGILREIKGRRGAHPRTMPGPEFLAFHRDNIFKRSRDVEALL